MFGWTPETCLEMPARRFFAVTKSAYESKRKERSEEIDSFLYELTYIASIPGVGDVGWTQKLQQSIWDRMHPITIEDAKIRNKEEALAHNRRVALRLSMIMRGKING